MFSIRTEILKFLKEEVEKDSEKFQKKLKDKTFLSDLAFLTHFTDHLNILNLNLQGKEKSISNLLHFISGFEIQLNLFKTELSKEELHNFSCCAEIKKEFQNIDFSEFVDLINEIQLEFNFYFKYILPLKDDILLFNNCLSVPIAT